MKVGIYAEILQHKKIFGISTFLTNLVRHLDKYISHDEILLLTLSCLPKIKSFSNLKQVRIGYQCLKNTQIQRPLVHLLISEIKKIDVVYWPYPKIYLLKKPVNRIVFTVHDLIPLLFPQWHSKFTIYLDYKIMLKKALKYAETIVCVSETTKNDLEKLFGKKYREKTVVVYNGLNLGLFSPKGKSEIEKIKKEFGISKEYVLYTGGFHPRKNVETLIKAFDVVRKKHDIQLVLTGEGLGKFKKFDETYFSSKFRNDIKVLGYIDERKLPALYSGATVYVNPSFYEGFGMGPLEALACGTPVISSDIKVVDELIPFVEKFDPKNYIELSEKIIELIEDERKRKEIAHKGMKTAKKFSWDKTAKRYSQILMESSRK